MTAPIITITSISKNKISDEVGHDQAVIKFTCDQLIIGWEARAGGIFHDSGLLVGCGDQVFPSDYLYPSNQLFPSDYKVLSGTTIQFEVDDEELQQDGEYRINIYACNENGEWTPYE